MMSLLFPGAAQPQPKKFNRKERKVLHKDHQVPLIILFISITNLLYVQSRFLFCSQKSIFIRTPATTVASTSSLAGSITWRSGVICNQGVMAML